MMITSGAAGNDDARSTRRIEPNVLRSTGNSQYHAIALRAAHDRSHPVGVYWQRPDHPLGSAASALCARGREIRDENLAEHSTGGVSIDSTRVADALSTAARLVRLSRSKAHCRSSVFHDKKLVTG